MGLFPSKSHLLVLSVVSLLTQQTLQQAQMPAEYEFIVIGSGPGGGPLAANLARAGHSVLLLEAGADNGEDLLQRVPGFANFGSEDDHMAWSFFVDHYSNTTQAYRDNKYSWKHSNGTIFSGPGPQAGDIKPLGVLYPRGAMLGGSSQVNGLNFMLPPDEDWNDIANLTGDTSWEASNMRRLFEDLEHCDYLPNGTAGHGFNGYVHSNQNELDIFRPQTGFIEVLRNLYTASGRPTPNSTDEIFKLMRRDMNRLDPARYQRDDVYAMPLHVNKDHIRTGARHYIMETFTAKFANGSRRYPGLTISTNSLASRVLFSNSTEASNRPRATGVEYLLGQALYKADPRFNDRGARPIDPVTAIATREVIVAGGAFNTPQILMLSGIGPRTQLEQHGIPIVVDLPAVGSNLQDTYEGGVTVEAATDFFNVFANCTGGNPGDTCFAQYQANHTGPYTLGAAPAAVLKRSSVATTPDADLYLFGGAISLFRGFFPGYSYAQVPPSTFWWSIVKMRPQNHGTVRLRSGDPLDPPLINFNYFGEGGAHDLQALKEGVEFARGVFNMTGAPYAPFLNIEPSPEGTIEQGLMDQTFSHHCSSTCAIGPVGDKSTCVDSRFRVQGVDGLRVVDNSVFPKPAGAFPVLPTFLIGQKAFETIKEEY